MCGIVGIASPQRIIHRDWLARGRDALRHRGPDDLGEWWSPDGRVGFAHRRLAIVDLSVAGRQPMIDASGELYIVFNGEIYNFQDLKKELAAAGYVFATQSDTEVILAAYRQWGNACLDKLNGMFAFALYDRRCQQLLLARDRAGEKPLFYSLSDDAIRFASELKAILADSSVPRVLDPEAMDCYLADGFVGGERCILRGLRKLPPAHALLFDVTTGQARVWRYWQPPPLLAQELPDVAAEETLLDELEYLLADAVQRQLVADVPVGVLLSGGVDSSLITALAVRAKPGVKTFTVRFPGYGGYDETRHARLISRHFGSEHIEVEAAEIDITMLPVLARQFDEPLIDSSMLPTYLVSEVVRQHCKVALGGDGGDELFGGYPHYDRMLRMRRTAQRLPEWVRTMVASLADSAMPVGCKGRAWLRALTTDLDNKVPLVTQIFDAGTRSLLINRALAVTSVAERIREGFLSTGNDLLQRSTRLDFATYLAEDLLVKVDRASMLNSLEIRSPLLDTRVMEFAFGKVPSSLKATERSRKVLLKKLVARLLPSAFDRTRKQGFSVPLSAWLKTERWRDYFREVLLDPAQLCFDHRHIEHLLRLERVGCSNAEKLFGLVMFELWRREYCIDALAGQQDRTPTAVLPISLAGECKGWK